MTHISDAIDLPGSSPHFARFAKATEGERSVNEFLRVIKSERLHEIYHMWRTVAAGRIGPRRSEMTPSLLRRNLSHTFLVEVSEDGSDYRFGFTGDRIMEFLGSKCTAPTLAGMRDQHFFDGAYELFAQSVSTRKPLVSGPKPTNYKGKEHLERQVLVLPLSENNLDVSGLLGAFDTWQLGTNAHSMRPVLAD